MGQLSLLTLCTIAVKASDFTDTYLYVNPTQPQEAAEIQIDFFTAYELTGNGIQGDVIYVQLPKFTIGGGGKKPGPNIPRGELVISPSVYFEARWIEGEFNNLSHPFPNSTLALYVQEEVTIPAGTSLRVRIYRSNNIKVYCGYDRPQNTDNDFFLMWTNASKATGHQQQIEYGDRVGNGCSKISDCGLVGECDFCQQKCYCWPGKGGSDNYKNTGSMDCTQFECPEGPRWGSMPLSETDGGHVAQTMACSGVEIEDPACSGAGLCIAESGECECFDGFTGDACQRRISTCGVGGKCSGHGQCLPMHHLARAKEASPLSEGMSSYGDDHTVREHTGTWDWNTMMGCACDSSWPVGFGPDEFQLGEYYGADCSKKRCPTGVAPWIRNTDPNDAWNDTARGEVGAAPPARDPLNRVGRKGNQHLVECSGRGSCNEGRCSCFAGYTGHNCDRWVPNKY